MNLPPSYPASPRPAQKPITRAEILSLVRRGVITFPLHAMTDSVQTIKRKHRKYAHRKDTRTGSHYQKRGIRMKTGRNRPKQAPTLPQEAPQQAGEGQDSGQTGLRAET